MRMNPSQLPVGQMLVILFDNDGNVVVEKDTPLVISHTIINGDSKFNSLDGADMPDLRDVGYTIVPLEDVVKVIRKDNLIRYFQKA